LCLPDVAVRRFYFAAPTACLASRCSRDHRPRKIICDRQDVDGRSGGVADRILVDLAVPARRSEFAALGGFVEPRRKTLLREAACLRRPSACGKRMRLTQVEPCLPIDRSADTWTFIWECGFGCERAVDRTQAPTRQLVRERRLHVARRAGIPDDAVEALAECCIIAALDNRGEPHQLENGVDRTLLNDSWPSRRVIRPFIGSHPFVKPLSLIQIRPDEGRETFAELIVRARASQCVSILRES
jgi:hypothetical protein